MPSALKHYERGRFHVRDDDPYRPYDGIEDTLRNQLLAFMAKWSPEAVAFEKGKRPKELDPDQFLDDRSLSSGRRATRRTSKAGLLIERCGYGTARRRTGRRRGGRQALVGPRASSGRPGTAIRRSRPRGYVLGRQPLSEIAGRDVFDDRFGERGTHDARLSFARGGSLRWRRAARRCRGSV